MKPIAHGNNSGYARGCRCDDCREAHKLYARKWRGTDKRGGKPSLKAYRNQIGRAKKKEPTAKEWAEAYPHLTVARPDLIYREIMDDFEEDMSWIQKMLESRQTIWATHCPMDGGDVSVEAALEMRIEKEMQDAAFRKRVLHWKGVIA